MPWEGITRGAFSLCLLLARLPASAADLQWAGTAWQVRSGSGHPCGSDLWSAKNAWVDDNGWLHLRLSRGPDGRFACVEVASRDRFGYGRYAFEVRGPIGAIDPNVVLGIFMYPTPDVGPDGTDEIDVEIARWGKGNAPQVNDTVWNHHTRGNRHVELNVPDALDEATFAFNWQPGVVSWEPFLPGIHAASFHGDIADKPQRLILNLWLFRQSAPRNGQPVEFMIKSSESL